MNRIITIPVRDQIFSTGGPVKRTGWYKVYQTEAEARRDSDPSADDGRTMMPLNRRCGTQFPPHRNARVFFRLAQAMNVEELAASVQVRGGHRARRARLRRNKAA